jgi:hypothetical protein
LGIKGLVVVVVFVSWGKLKIKPHEQKNMDKTRAKRRKTMGDKKSNQKM